MRSVSFGLLAFVVCASPALSQDFNTDAHTRTSPQTEQREQANAALEAHDFERALKLLVPLAEASPKDARLLYDLGSTEDALDQSSAAMGSYRAAIQDDPGYTEPRVALGLLLARMGKFEEARTELLEATRNPQSDLPLRARAYRALARLDAKTRPAEASAELLDALKLSPETPEDTLLTAELAQAAPGNAWAAEAAYRRLLAVRPDDAAAAAALAHLLIAQKRSAEAEPLLARALEAHPGDPALTTQLAALDRTQGKTPEALALVEGLHRTQPQDANVTRLLADLYLDAGADARAEPLLAVLSARNPKDTGVGEDRARALIHLRRFAEAQNVLAPLVAQPALFPNPADLGQMAGELAFVCSENNDPEGTLRALEVRARILPTSAPVLFLTAISHDKLHHVKLAQAAYKEFLAASNGSNPDEEFEAQHRLVALQHMK